MRKLLSLITALALILSLTVPSAFAADDPTCSYSDIGGVCMLSWTDLGSSSYDVKVYREDDDDPDDPYMSTIVTDSNCILARALGLATGESYYFTVTYGKLTITSDVFTYDSSKEAYWTLIYSASYSASTDTLSWKSDGTSGSFRVDVYETGSTEVIYSAYTSSNSISGSEIFPANGSYWFKIWIVDGDGNNISTSAAWICVETASYEYSGYPVVTFDANGGYLNGDSKITTLISRADSSGNVTFPTKQFKSGMMLDGWRLADGTKVTEDTVFSSDTTVCAHWVTCDHSGSSGGSNCDLMALCSVCGNYIPYAHTMEHIDAVAPTCGEDGILDCYYCTSCGRYYSSADGYPSELLDSSTDPATGNHTYDENNKCTTCGAIGAADSEATTDTSSGVKSILSITATDGSTNSALSAVVNGSSITSSTVTMSRTNYKLTGKLNVGQVSTSTSTITLSDTNGSLTLGNASSSTAISASTTLTGTYTDATSGDTTSMKGEVLFYGDISYSGDTTYKDADVINRSTFSISLTPTSDSTLDASTPSVLRYDTSTSSWEALEVTGTSTDETTGQVTLSFTTSSLSPIMVLAVEEVQDEPHTHTYEGVVTKEATCTEDGVKTYTCSVCEDTYTETIPATGHTESDEVVIENKVAATCTADGSYDSVVYCTVCEAEVSRVTVTTSATGHSYVDGVCENCGEHGASESTTTDSTNTQTSTVVVSDTVNSVLKPNTLDGATVNQATISITSTEAGTLTVTEIKDTVTASGTLTFSDSSSSYTFAASEGEITGGTVLTGVETNSSGAVIENTGTVLFYGDIDFETNNATTSTLTITLDVSGTLNISGDITADNIKLLHYENGGWVTVDGDIEISSSGLVTITAETDSYSPFAVILVSEVKKSTYTSQAEALALLMRIQALAANTNTESNTTEETEETTVDLTEEIVEIEEPVEAGETDLE
ncbi:MAG: hypothetical protein LIO72_04980 [Ruminococcus sp.]|nr:hypothetical protein [Ruminococcus sp.]